MKSYTELDLKTNSNGRVYQGGENLEKVKDGLDSVSPSLCLAKFTQVTLHLGSGKVHSCHHPRLHTIPPHELENNPSALFNTSHLKQARKQMLSGERPSECDYCWRIEDNGATSDRHFKSNEDWAIKQYDKISNSTGNEDFKPTYLEVSFGNACNLKCVYCGPEFSTQWVDEIKHQGPIKITDGSGGEQWAQGWQDLDSLNIPNREFNPYIDAFWKWFPEIYPELQTYRITGGEPILNKNTFKSLDYVIENPRDDLEIGINSNLSVPDNVWKKFIEKIKELEHKANYNKITVYTSVESWGERAEYARTGLDFQLLKNRLEELLETTSARCVIMATYNCLAITSFKELLEYTLGLKRKYNFNIKRQNVYDDTGVDIRVNDAPRSSHWYRVGIDIPYLRHPSHLDAQYCSEDLLLNYMIPCLEFMIKHNSENDFETNIGFEKHELDKFERIVENRLWFKNHSEAKQNQAKFYDFINEIDSRRQMNFLETFPEMEEFYYKCQSERAKIAASYIPIKTITE